MTPDEVRTELFAQLKEPFTGELLFDCIPDLVFFIKNRRGEYVVVNQTLVARCGRREKRELIGRGAQELFPGLFGKRYRAQDEAVLGRGESIIGQLELHLYPNGVSGWCITYKLPLWDNRGQVVGLVGISKDLQRSSPRSEDYAVIADALEQIQTRYQDPLRVQDLAARAGLSLYQFEERIRALFNLTVGQLIQKTRMDAAVRLLRESRDPVSKIALDCGYSDQSAFTRQFRRATGLTPLEFRRGSQSSRA